MMLKQRQFEGRTEIFDPIRRKWVLLTEEEKVRQFFIHFIIDEKKFPHLIFLLKNKYQSIN